MAQIPIKIVNSCCDANEQNLLFEAYCDGRFVGAADSMADAAEYEGCCDGRFEIHDTRGDRDDDGWDVELEMESESESN